MHDPPVAFPAVPLLVDLHDRLLVAPDAVFLEHLCPMGGQLDVVGHRSRVKESDILQAVESFPDIVYPCIIVGQMAVNAHLSSMSAGMCPGLIFGFHHMASDAEFRLVGSGKEPGRADREEQEQKDRAASGNDERKDGLAGFEHIHNVTSLSGQLQTDGRLSKIR